MNLPVTREEVLNEIKSLETHLVELRSILPTPYKTIFMFRCKPQPKVWIYATGREEAERKLRQRMNRDYGESWRLANNVVDEFDNPPRYVWTVGVPKDLAFEAASLVKYLILSLKPIDNKVGK